MRRELKRGRGPLRWSLLALFSIVAGGLYLALRSRSVEGAAAAGTAEPEHVVSAAYAAGSQRDDGAQLTSRSMPSAVSGRVRTATGAALAGASVCVAPSDAACCTAVSCTVSGAGGHFQLEYRSAPGAMLLASRAGYLPVRQELRAPSETPLLLTLAAGGVRVTGVVVDATGGPIAGAGLSALGAQDDVLAVGVSDSAGLFGLDVASGALRVRAHADGYSEQLRAVRAPAMGLRFALTPAAVIVGRTIDEAGLPVAGVRVVALGRDGLWTAPPAAHSSEDGSFRLSELAAGRYALSAVSERGRSQEQLVHVGVAQTTEPVELTLHAATTLTAIVKVSGTPCAEGSLSASGAVGGYAPLQEGRAVLDGIVPGRYRVSVECEAGLDQSDWLDIGPDPVTRVWELEQGLQVRGVALTPAGTAMPGVPIEVSPVDEPFGRTSVRCTTDERGEFSCAGLEPGDYECAIGHGLPARSESVRITVTEQSSPRVVLRAHREGTLRVRIEGAGSLDLQALALVARSKGGAMLGELVGDEILFEPLALGSYEIASESSTAGSGTLVELTREGQIAELTLPLPSAHTLTGRVVDDDGQGIPDAWVRATLTTRNALFRPVTPVLTGGDGAFALPGLLPGSYRLVVSSSGGEAQLDGIASDRSDVLVRLPSYGSLEVSLRSAAGSPVGDFIVAYRSSAHAVSVQTPGSRGAWSAPWLPPGRYELTAQAAEGSVTTSLELPPGGELRVALRLEP